MFNEIKNVNAGDSDVSAHGGKICPMVGGERSIRSAAGRAILCGIDPPSDLAKCHLHFPSAEALPSFPCHGR